MAAGRRSAVAGVTKPRSNGKWFKVTHKGRYIGGAFDWHKAVAKKAEVAGQSLTKLLATAALRTGLTTAELRPMKSSLAVQLMKRGGAKSRFKYVQKMPMGVSCEIL